MLDALASSKHLRQAGVHPVFFPDINTIQYDKRSNLNVVLESWQVSLINGMEPKSKNVEKEKIKSKNG